MIFGQKLGRFWSAILPTEPDCSRQPITAPASQPLMGGCHPMRTEQDLKIWSRIYILVRTNIRGWKWDYPERYLDALTVLKRDGYHWQPLYDISLRNKQELEEECNTNLQTSGILRVCAIWNDSAPTARPAGAESPRLLLQVHRSGSKLMLVRMD